MVWEAMVSNVDLSPQGVDNLAGETNLNQIIFAACQIFKDHRNPFILKIRAKPKKVQKLVPQWATHCEPLLPPAHFLCDHLTREK
jgi:hypothetical protein